MDITWVGKMAGEGIEVSRARRSVNVDEIISRIHSYETDFGRFIDREEEVRNIIAREDIVRSGRITVVYGPKECGKSTFFRVLEDASNKVDAGLDVEIVSILENC